MLAQPLDLDDLARFGEPEVEVPLPETVEPAIPAMPEGGLCVGLAQEIFITAGYKSCQAAARVCHECPVRPECLQRALSFPHGELYGVWGGYALHNGAGRRNASRWLSEHGYEVPANPHPRAQEWPVQHVPEP